MPGVYQGINSHNITFFFVAQENIIQLNEIYKQRGICDEEQTKSVQMEADRLQSEIGNNSKVILSATAVGVGGLHEGLTDNSSDSLTGTSSNATSDEKQQEKSAVRIIRKRNIYSTLQRFSCRIPTKKVQHGWLLDLNFDEIPHADGANKSSTIAAKNGRHKFYSSPENSLLEKDKIPFNTLVWMTIDINTDEVIHISPIIVSGTINHINTFGQVWITSDLQIIAIEEISSLPSSLIGNIVSLDLTNISNRSLQLSIQINICMNNYFYIQYILYIFLQTKKCKLHDP